MAESTRERILDAALRAFGTEGFAATSLDALATEWLQGFLQRFKGALVLITHDRYFLERVTDTIIELDAGQLQRYPGNYGAYLQKKAEEEVDDAPKTVPA